MSGGFEDLGLSPELVRATQELDWLLPTDVQDEAIPYILGGGDVMVAAETGNGKTGAFALPALQLIYETRNEQRRKLRQGNEASSATSSSASKPPQEPPKMSGADRTPFVAVASDGCTVQSRQEFKWGGIRADRGVINGNYYFECTIHDDGISRVGWSTVAASLELGTDQHGYGFGGTGKKSNNRKFDSYGEPFGRGDIIGCYLSVGQGGGKLGFSKNGKYLGDAYDLPPNKKGPFYPTVCLKNAELQVNFGGKTGFRYPPEGGHLGLAEASENDVVISTGEADTSGKKESPDDPVVLVLEPAKDLAEQTATEIEKLSKFVTTPPIRHSLLIGGVNPKDAVSRIRRGVDVITATPGKLLDFVSGGKLKLNSIRILILDEADRLCDKEGMELIDKIWKKLHEGRSSSSRLQVGFFSATLHSDDIQNLASKLCYQPTWIDLKGKENVPETVHHAVVEIDPYNSSLYGDWNDAGGPAGGVPTDEVHARDAIRAGRDGKPIDELAASEAVKKLKPPMVVDLINKLNMDQVLVFCRTNYDCDNLEKYLIARGGGKKFVPGQKVEKGVENPYSCCVMAGQRSMKERRAALQSFKDGDARILIATDVAARGIDIKELPYVINMTLPDRPENYIHRVGRVGRVDKMGLAISLVSMCKEKVWFYDKRKWEGKTLSTKLAHEGGCCIWYDEQDLLRQVEKRLDVPQTFQETSTLVDHKIPRINIRRAVGKVAQTLHWDFSFPRGMGENTDGIVYGEQKGAGSKKSKHVAALAPAVNRLSELAIQAQHSFFHLQQCSFGDVSAPTETHGATPPPPPAEHQCTVNINVLLNPPKRYKDNFWRPNKVDRSQGSSVGGASSGNSRKKGNGKNKSKGSTTVM